MRCYRSALLACYRPFSFCSVLFSTLLSLFRFIYRRTPSIASSKYIFVVDVIVFICLIFHFFFFFFLFSISRLSSPFASPFRRLLLHTHFTQISSVRYCLQRSTYTTQSMHSSPVLVLCAVDERL